MKKEERRKIELTCRLVCIASFRKRGGGNHLNQQELGQKIRTEVLEAVKRKTENAMSRLPRQTGIVSLPKKISIPFGGRLPAYAGKAAFPSQNQFAGKETLTLVGLKGKIEKIRVLGAGKKGNTGWKSPLRIPSGLV